MTRFATIVEKNHSISAYSVEVKQLLEDAGFETEIFCRSKNGEFDDSKFQISPKSEIVIVIGGDGTILQTAHNLIESETPILGINSGHMGFLAEADRLDLEQSIRKVISADYSIEKRSVITALATLPDGSECLGYALNEAVVEKQPRGKIIDVAISVDGAPLTAFACDGIIFSTSTGSTAYAFSAGGPLIWPKVDALLAVPIAPYSLFDRPLVIPGDSKFSIEILDTAFSDATLSLDGGRQINLPVHSHIEFTKSPYEIAFAKINNLPFSTRLQKKFDLPQQGWRQKKS